MFCRWRLLRVCREMERRRGSKGCVELARAGSVLGVAVDLDGGLFVVEEVELLPVVGRQKRSLCLGVRLVVMCSVVVLRQ